MLPLFHTLSDSPIAMRKDKPAMKMMNKSLEIVARQCATEYLLWGAAYPQAEG
jgi:hypothetical protein